MLKVSLYVAATVAAGFLALYSIAAWLLHDAFKALR